MRKLTLATLTLHVLVSSVIAVFMSFSAYAQINKVLSLDGDGDYVKVLDDDSLDVSEQITLEAWVKIKDADFPSDYIFDKRDSNGGYVLNIGNNIQFGVSDYHNFPNSIQDETWTHIATVYDGDNLTVFLNGLKQESIPETSDIVITASPLFIGQRYTYGSRFNGLIDEVRIWNVARTQEQIQSTMNTTLTGLESGLVGYWNFDDGTANDLSPHGNDGTLQGDATITEGSPGRVENYEVKRVLWKEINQGWFNSGTNVKNGDSGVIAVQGFSNANPQGLGWQGWVGPGGYSEDGGDDGIISDAPFQSVIYKIGESGTPHYLGTGGGKITFDADGELMFNVNNTNAGESDGAFLFSVALEGEYPSDQGVLGDLSGDKTVSAYDASLILQYVVGLIDSFPVEKMSASKLAVPAIYELRIQNSSVKANEELIRLPIAINNRDSLTAGAFTIKYDNSVLKASAIMPRPQLSGAYWKSKIDEDAGEIRFAFAKSSPTEQSKDTDIALLEFEPIGNVEGVTTNLRFDDVQIAESISIKRINGSISFLPRKSALLQNYPNPFNPDTWIPFKLSDNANVVISIYDVGGQLVRKIGLGKMSAGMYLNKDKAVYWDGCNNAGEKVSSGVYFYNLHAGDYNATKRMLILK